MNDETAIKLLTKTRLFMPIINQNNELKEYLINRYNDIPINKFTYKEVKYRLIHNINIRPVCRVCGKPVNFCGDDNLEKLGKTINGYRKTCSKECKFIDKTSYQKMSETKQNKSNEEKELEKYKRIQTCIQKYGVTNTFISAKDKIKETMITKYGGYTLQSKELRTKQEQTMETIYGAKNIFSSEYGKNKIKETQYKKYGSLYCQTDFGRKRLSESAKLAQEKRYKTNKEKYGNPYLINNKAIKEKRLQTLKKNKTYKTSKEEQLLYEIIQNLYSDAINQYHSNKYPFNCDFYIPSLDLYIEYNGTWFHNSHPYNADSIDDQHEIAQLVEMHKDTVIKTWTISDPHKVNVAKGNNIKLLILYPSWHNDWKTYIKSKNKSIYLNNIQQSLKILCESIKNVEIKY